MRARPSFRHFIFMVLSIFFAISAFSAQVAKASYYSLDVTVKPASAGSADQYRVQIGRPQSDGKALPDRVLIRGANLRWTTLFEGKIDSLAVASDVARPEPVPSELHIDDLSVEGLAIKSGGQLLIFDHSKNGFTRIAAPQGSIRGAVALSASEIIALSENNMKFDPRDPNNLINRYSVVKVKTTYEGAIYLVNKSDGSSVKIADDDRFSVALDPHDPQQLLLTFGSQEKRVPLSAENFRLMSNVFKSKGDNSFYLQSFRKILEQNIVEQPEAVELALSIESSLIAAGGHSEEGANAMLMGLPGTGKDTTVEQYIIARHLLKYGNTDQNQILDQHVFRLPKLKTEADIWILTGSATGYKGSDHISPFIKFLVLHSGGQYKIVPSAGPNSPEHVAVNPLWSPGMVLPGYFAPADGIVFGNEVHDWKKDLINTFLKEPFEKRNFVIANAGPGVPKIHVPVTIFLASNNGIDLISSKDTSGKRFGSPLTYAQQMSRWSAVANNKAALKDNLARPTPGNPEGGMSDEMVNRIPSSYLLLLRPMSPQGKIRIASLIVQWFSKRSEVAKSNGFPSFKLQPTPQLLEFLTTYNADPEEGPRDVKDKVDALLKDVINKAILSRQLMVANGSTLQIDIAKSADGTFRLIVNGQSLFIPATKIELTKQPVSDKQLADYTTVAQRIGKRVKGLDGIIYQVVQAIRASANTGSEDAPAIVFAFFGVSSTGKTELAQAIHKELYHTEDPALVIDFSKIKTVQELKSKLTGIGTEKSDFMYAYDRANGDLLVVFDEFDKAPIEVQHECYDLFREKVITSFSDREPRPMKHVKIVLNANTGTDWYKNIPRDIPEDEQHAAARDIHHHMTSDPGIIRGYLMKFFTEAFINRIGIQRIFWFPPHTHRTIRELIQLKIVNLFKKFAGPATDRRTWEITFLTEKDYERTLESVEKYGFQLWEQGASIQHFIDESLGNAIQDLLLSHGVRSGAKVAIVKKDDVKMGDKFSTGYTAVGFDLIVEGQKEAIPLVLRGKPVTAEMQDSQTEFHLTSGHESGHSLVTYGLLGDKIKPTGLTVIPGVAEIRGEMVRYLGLATSEQTAKYTLTREFLVAKIAGSAGGEAAEMLMSKNHIKSAGASNDMQGITLMAQDAVARYGFSDKWGRKTIQPDQTFSDFISTLSEAEKVLFSQEVNSVIEEGRALALNFLKANFGILNTMSKMLAAKGEFDEAYYNDVVLKYIDQHVVRPGDPKYLENIKTYDAAVLKESPPSQARDPELFSFVMKPEHMVDVAAWRAEAIKVELAQADLTSGKKFVTISLTPFAPYLRQGSAVSGSSVSSETRHQFVTQVMTNSKPVAGPSIGTKLSVIYQGGVISCSALFSGK